MRMMDRAGSAAVRSQSAFRMISARATSAATRVQCTTRLWKPAIDQGGGETGRLESLFYAGSPAEPEWAPHLVRPCRIYPVEDRCKSRGSAKQEGHNKKVIVFAATSKGDLGMTPLVAACSLMKLTKVTMQIPGPRRLSSGLTAYIQRQDTEVLSWCFFDRSLTAR